MRYYPKYRQWLKTSNCPSGEFLYWGYGVMPGDVMDTFVDPLDFHKPSEQWTGLTDKHGIKIYAGDILKTDHNIGSGWTEEPVHTGIVEWHHTGEWVMTNRPLVQSLPQLVRNRWSLEIIGNIHENPESIR